MLPLAFLAFVWLLLVPLGTFPLAVLAPEYAAAPETLRLLFPLLSAALEEALVFEAASLPLAAADVLRRHRQPRTLPANHDHHSFSFPSSCVRSITSTGGVEEAVGELPLAAGEDGGDLVLPPGGAELSGEPAPDVGADLPLVELAEVEVVAAELVAVELDLFALAAVVARAGGEPSISSRFCNEVNSSLLYFPAKTLHYPKNLETFMLFLLNRIWLS